MTHLTFIKKEIEGRKTPIFDIVSDDPDFPIGTISWYGAWRQYVLITDKDVIWSWDCLKEVSEFIKNLMEERKNSIIL